MKTNVSRVHSKSQFLFIYFYFACQKETKDKPKAKLPAFCQMEVNLHKHLNARMVFRAGSDEDYRKYIAK